MVSSQKKHSSFFLPSTTDASNASFEETTFAQEVWSNEYSPVPKGQDKSAFYIFGCSISYDNVCTGVPIYHKIRLLLSSLPANGEVFNIILVAWILFITYIDCGKYCFDQIEWVYFLICSCRISEAFSRFWS